MSSLPFPDSRKLPGHKVYVIELPRGTSLEASVSKRDDLGKSIGAIVKSVNTPVFFHEYKDPVGGLPNILLECPEGLTLLLKSMVPGIGAVSELPADTATQRSPKLWDYFTGAPARPALPKPSKKPPSSFDL